jgi:hypothetical protein
MKRLFTIIGLLVALTLSSFVAAQTAVVVSNNFVDNKVHTFRSVINGVTLASSATDIATITGSASKTIYVKSIKVSGVATTSGRVKVLLMKRSTANADGTAVAQVVSAMDSGNATKVATVRAYTANPTTGTGITIGAKYVGFLSTTAAVVGDAVGWDFGDMANQFVVLRGVAQTLAVNLGGVTVTGGAANVEIEWMEK